MKRTTRRIFPRLIFFRFMMLFSFLLVPSLYAEEFVVPSSWEKIAEARSGEIVPSVQVQDGWVAWMEKRLDPRSALARAQSFFVGLYRKKLGAEDVETLIEPNQPRPWGDQFILGFNGIVSSNYRSNWGQLLFPVNPAARVLLCPETEELFPGMPGEEGKIKILGCGEYTPIRIYQDTLLCLSGQYGRQKLMRVPFGGREPDFSRSQVVTELTDQELMDTCFNNNAVLYSVRRSLTLYDTKAGKKIFTFELKKDIGEFKNLCLQDEYAYFTINSFSAPVREIFRFANKTRTLERMPLPASFRFIEDFTPERLIGSYQRMDRLSALFEIDLRSGEQVKFDFPWSKQPLDGSGLSDMMGGGQDTGPASKPKILCSSADAASGTVLAAFENSLYRVPQNTETVASWPSFGWTSTMRDEIKDALLIKDEKGKEIEWHDKNTFMVAAIQAVSEMAKPRENRRHLEMLIREAAHHGAKVVVLPETAITGYMSYDLKTTWQNEGKNTTPGLKGLDPAAYAEIMPGDSTKAFVGLAYELKIYLTAPFLEIDPATGNYFNTVVLMSPTGQYLKHYRKINPWPFAECGWASKGDFGNVYVDTSYGRMALLICFDINFEPPNLKSLGVDHLLYSIAWVDQQDSQWFSVTLPHIAKNHNLNIIGANWTVPVGNKPDWFGYGKSLIISRNGDILAKTDRDIGEKIIYAELPIVRNDHSSTSGG